MAGAIGSDGCALALHSVEAPPRQASLSAISPVPAAGPAIVWICKALAETSIDGFVDVALAVLVGAPLPGAGVHVGNFLANLVPYVGTLTTARRIQRLHGVIDRIAATARRFQQARMPGARDVRRAIDRDSAELRRALDRLNLDEAKRIFPRLLGKLREVQIAAALEDKGYHIYRMEMKSVAGRPVRTDVDIVYGDGGQVIFAQVKAAKAAYFGRGSQHWSDFQQQAERTILAARAYTGEHGVGVSVRYFVDEASDEVREWLNRRGIVVVRNRTLLDP
ncbi:MAG: hypothetical protein AAGC55_20160 [Myxococcota bacterium]